MLAPIARRAWVTTRTSVVAVGATAVAVAVCTAAFALVNGAVLKPVGIRSLDRIASVAIAVNGSAAPYMGFTPERFSRLKERAPGALGSWVGVTGTEANLSTDGVSQPVLVEEVSGPYFDLLHVRPLFGELPDSHHFEGNGAVIGERLWRRTFGSDPRALGSVVRLMSRPFVIVGIAPATFRGVRLPELLSADVWIPMGAVSSGPFAMQVFAGLTPGVSFAAARNGIRTLGRGLDPSDPSIGVDLLPAWRGMVPEPLIAIGSAVAVASVVVCCAILLLAGATAVNLSRARFLSRRREFAVRLALGAERSHLTRQAVADALAMTVPAAILGAGLAMLLLKLADTRQLLPGTGAFVAEINSTPDVRVVGFVVLAAIVLTVLLARAEVEAVWMDSAALGGGGLAANGVSPSISARMQLGTWQLSVATTLLILTGLFLRSSASRVERDAAFPIDHAVLGQVQVPTSPRASGAASQLAARMIEMPRPNGSRLEVTTDLPLPRSTGIQRASVSAGGKAGPTALTQVIGVSAGFLDVLGVAVMRGSGLATAPHAQVDHALVDVTLANALWPAGDAVGRRFWLSGSDRSLEVVGVVASPAVGGTPQDLRRFVFVPFETRDAASFDVLLKGPGSDAALTNQLRHIVTAANSSATLIDPGPLRSYADPYTRVAAAAFGPTMIAALLAIVLTAAGLYAVVNHNVVSRLYEFGIRNALGATRASIYSMVIRECVAVVVRGTAIGVGVAAFASLLLPTQIVFTLNGRDLLMLTAIPAGAFLVAILAMLPAARRATRSDPLAAMRAL